MPVLLDTDVSIELLRHSQFALSCVAGCNEPLFVSSVTAAELHFGAANSSRPGENMEKARQFLANFRRLTLTDATAERYGLLKAALRRRSVQVSPFDLLIASMALENDCTLATGNARHFKDIDGLRIVDWVRPG